METYKLGNKVKATLRAYSPGKIGNTEIKYCMQPYTIINDADVQVSFRDTDGNARTTQTLLNYNVDYVDSVSINNVPLNDKILNLVFQVDNAPLRTKSANCNSNDAGVIYLPDEKMYQVFIYDDNGELESAHDELVDYVVVNKPNSNYLIIYICDGTKGFSLNRTNNVTMALDLEVTGNENDTTNKFWLHFDKCSLSVNKNLYFSGSINTIDLKFKVLKSDNDYITVK